MRHRTIFLAIFTIALHGVAHGSLLQNGSFEQVTGSSPDDWNPVGNLAVIGSQGESDGTLALAFSFGNLASNGHISQTVATTPGLTYLLSLDFGKYAVNQPTQVARLEVDAYDSTTIPGFGGPSLLSAILSDNTPGPGNSSADASVYDAYAFSFTASGTSTTLRFGDVSDPQGSGGGFDAMLDNVVLVAIPEPSSGALVLLLGLCSFARRRAVS